ncbi:hypothetical protein FDUTEX481_09828 [Tolypothrix sp. PCC 7601]|nr:hypothetical protein FDUTEX481_09828 [Tolypothrix sp. PCC 7601]BAY93635.1 hypothetical protein NIES3275_56770 [Microchaete diplosiphon NIES-3275]
MNYIFDFLVNTFYTNTYKTIFNRTTQTIMWLIVKDDFANLQ